MTQTVYHAYTQTVGDGTATSVVRPSDWNSSHIISGSAFAFGVSNLGDTLGATGVTGTRVVLAGVSGMTLSQATDANGATISLVPVPNYINLSYTHNSAAFYSSSTSAHVDTSVSLIRIQPDDQLSFTQIGFPVSISASSSSANNTAALVLAATCVLYTRNGNAFNPILGTVSNTTYTWASNNTGWSSVIGPRLLTFGLATSVSQEFYVAIALSTNSTSSIGTATTALRATISPVFGTTYTASNWALVSEATAATYNPVKPYQGIYNASISATNQTLSVSGLTQTGATAARANNVLIFRA